MTSKLLPRGGAFSKSLPGFAALRILINPIFYVLIDLSLIGFGNGSTIFQTGRRHIIGLFKRRGRNGDAAPKIRKPLDVKNLLSAILVIVMAGGGAFTAVHRYHQRSQEYLAYKEEQAQKARAEKYDAEFYEAIRERAAAEAASRKEKEDALREQYGGKTTLLSMIAGLETPDEGEIWLDDTCAFSKEKNINLPPKSAASVSYFRISPSGRT